MYVRVLYTMVSSLTRSHEFSRGMTENRAREYVQSILRVYIGTRPKYKSALLPCRRCIGRQRYFVPTYLLFQNVYYYYLLLSLSLLQ